MSILQLRVMRLFELEQFGDKMSMAFTMVSVHKIIPTSMTCKCEVFLAVPPGRSRRRVYLPSADVGDLVQQLARGRLPPHYVSAVQ